MDKTNIANLPRKDRVTDTVTIGIAGMTCDNCVRKVERALRGLPGIQEVAVDRAKAIAKVTYDDTATNVPAMHDALLKSGYKPVATPVE
ncbi:MAG TPA: heavy-metal-associated domain-containing protein [Candidatus Sulfotelmatobacter sp.]|nr:heavy-metal-associated domain-containing protein [Candidatus Sulfotelmatobacter sp.]HWI57249.1 heavy-metal-associated domain-containing protein [Bacillota bacterium]